MPDESWTVPKIKEYLDDKNIKYASTATKAELLALIGV